jgi:xanthine dehydrogenase molybdopterin-binding subunit B
VLQASGQEEAKTKAWQEKWSAEKQAGGQDEFWLKNQKSAAFPSQDAQIKQAVTLYGHAPETETTCGPEIQSTSKRINW